MSIVSDLLADIDAFLRDSGMPPTTFGQRALNDGKFVSRLRGGGGVTVKTIDRVRDFIAAERSKRGAATSEASKPATEDAAPADRRRGGGFSAPEAA